MTLATFEIMLLALGPLGVLAGWFTGIYAARRHRSRSHGR